MMSMGHWGGVARYGLPGLVAGLVLAWWGGGAGPTARAQGSNAPGAESNGMVAFSMPVNGTSSQMLYLIDTNPKSRAFAIYRVEPAGPAKGSGTVKLEAARKYEYDLKLSEFNNQAPEASAVEAMVKSLVK